MALIISSCQKGNFQFRNDSGIVNYDRRTRINLTL